MKTLEQMHKEFNDYMGEPENSVLRKSESIDHFSHHVYRQLQNQLKEAEVVINYYASRRTYSMDDYQGISGEMRSHVVLYGDSEEINDVTSYAGRRAREYQSKYMNKSGEA